METVESRVVNRSSGVFRTNCLDCLDRTNFIQAKLALITIEDMLEKLNFVHHNFLEEILKCEKSI